MEVQCAYCGAEWEATAQQANLVRNGKRVYCPGGVCTRAHDAELKQLRKNPQPWGWLGCKHIITDQLPTQDPPEIYAGY